MDVMHCRCCQNRMKETSEFNGYRHFICKNCSYETFFKIKNKPRDIKTIYENDSDYNDDLLVSFDHKNLLQWNHIKFLKYLKNKPFFKKAKILDIGCFNGFLVKELYDHGFDSHGIDFNRKAVEYGKTHYGLDGRISNNTLQDLHLRGMRFEVITLFEVIEHLDDFFPFLIEVEKLLQPKGILVISTPNSNMCRRPALDWPPHHLSRFSPDSLAHCIRRLGLEPVEAFEQTSSYDLLRHYFGTFFRNKKANTLRGGQFKKSWPTNLLRHAANKFRTVGYTALWPLDLAMRMAGVRYISQVIIARKSA